MTAETETGTATATAETAATATGIPEGKGELNNVNAQTCKTQKSPEGPHER